MTRYILTIISILACVSRLAIAGETAEEYASTLWDGGMNGSFSKNVFIVSASAVNYWHEQKNLPKRYQSRAICASPSPAGKCP